MDSECSNSLGEDREQFAAIRSLKILSEKKDPRFLTKSGNILSVAQGLRGVVFHDDLGVS